MEQFHQLVAGRRSIRRFTDQPIPQEILQAILEAARWSPSWANTQCWEVVVIGEERLKSGLASLLSPKNPVAIALGRGPVTLAISGRTGRSGFYRGEQSTVLGDWLLYDLGLFSQTICLGAHSLGIGSVIIGAFDHRRAAELLNLPQDCQLVSMIALGYPDQAPAAPKRRTLEAFVHYDRFGSHHQSSPVEPG